jgi:hypothetical protein
MMFGRNRGHGLFDAAVGIGVEVGRASSMTAPEGGTSWTDEFRRFRFVLRELDVEVGAFLGSQDSALCRRVRRRVDEDGEDYFCGAGGSGDCAVIRMRMPPFVAHL